MVPLSQSSTQGRYVLFLVALLAFRHRGKRPLGTRPIAPCRDVMWHQRKQEALHTKQHRCFPMNWSNLRQRMTKEPVSGLGTPGSGHWSGTFLLAFICLSLIVFRFEFSLKALGICFLGSIRSPPMRSSSHLWLEVRRPASMRSQFLTCSEPVSRLNRAVIHGF